MIAAVLLVLAMLVPEGVECDAPVQTHLQALGRAYGLALPQPHAHPPGGAPLARWAPLARVLA